MNMSAVSEPYERHTGDSEPGGAHHALHERRDDDAERDAANGLARKLDDFLSARSDQPAKKEAHAERSASPYA